MRTKKKKNNRRWSVEEDLRLVKQIRVFPQNLHKCFMIVGEELGRSDKAVASHWYTKVSQNPEYMCFFTASPKHVSKNRKNGMGVKSNASIWRRLLNVIKNF